MSTRRKQRVKGSTTMSGANDVSSVSANTSNPPGPEMVEQQPEHSDDGNEKYPAVIEVKDVEQHNAEQEAAAEERVARAAKAAGPRKLSSREIQQLTILFPMLKENEALDTPIPMEMIPDTIKDSFMATGGERNLMQRGLAKPVYGEVEGKKLMTGIILTDIAQHLFFKKVSKPESAEKVQKPNGTRATRTTNKYDGLLIRKLVDANPRQNGVQGYYSFELYTDGMSIKEYLAAKGPSVECTNGSMFDGPKLVHFEWDMNRGYVGLYRKDEPEKLEDGSDNPRYWAVNLSPSNK